LTRQNYFQNQIDPLPRQPTLQKQYSPDAIPISIPPQSSIYPTILIAAGLALHAAARLRDLLPIWQSQGKLITEQMAQVMDG
jgi:hypothetical protein